MPKPAKRIVLGLLIAWAVLPEWPRIPVEGASARDWNPRTFWFEPWGRSGVHKGIDIFARSGTPYVPPATAWCSIAGSSPSAARSSWCWRPSR